MFDEKSGNKTDTWVALARIGGRATQLRVISSCVACGMAVFAGCSKPAPDPKQSETEPRPPSSRTVAVQACSLLTDEEIEGLQGEAVQEKKPSGKAESDAVSSQCFYRLPSFTKSITLSVTQAGPEAGPRSPSEFWKQAFSEKVVNPRERADGRTKLPPERIEGLGDAAFWTGGPAGGLYVLKGDAVVFISLGSAGDEASRRDTARRLGELVLSRL